jgi:mannose-6-phosphate isomerase class I
VSVPPSSEAFRKTSQFLMPALRPEAPPGQYDIYPAFPLGSGQIELGYSALAEKLARAGEATIDGFPGVLWSHFREQLGAALAALGVRAAWFDVESALLPEPDLERLIARCLGGDDPIFGFRYPGQLSDFFVPERLAALRPDPAAELSIVYGCGAALAGWRGPLVYVDVPKNEIQFRQRARSVRCLGAAGPLDPKPAYKRSYFVDWVVAGRHKAGLLPRLDWIVDEQHPAEPALASGAALRQALTTMGRNYFRVRPWFEPGPWGGQWIREKIPQLSPDVPNYAWSFELIVPENGLTLESDRRLLEVSFDFLMFHDPRAVIGDFAGAFGYEFPIRYDFLDTFAGGNLSVQCHPRPEYIRRHFGETFTQDETYYILDCAPGARVNLGFQAGADPAEFRRALERSFNEAAPVDIPRYVASVPSHKHDLFLIPNGTIHGSGTDNLVLEISATPYIFTFKMYDWLRLDLDGRPRPLNIDRAFDNLYFERRGDRVQEELVSHLRALASGPGWTLVHLPTHRHHFYDVHRFEFSTQAAARTEGSCHVLSLVEGQSVLLETENGLRQRFHYAETFVVPAAAGGYRLISESGQPLKVVKTFLKPRELWVEGVVA